MNAKIIKKHRKECSAIYVYKRGDWISPLFLDTYDPQKHFLADSLCRQRNDKYRGTFKWILLQCNDPDCDAQVAVQVNAIEEFVQKELEKEGT